MLVFGIPFYLICLGLMPIIIFALFLYFRTKRKIQSQTPQEVFYTSEPPETDYYHVTLKTEHRFNVKQLDAVNQLPSWLDQMENCGSAFEKSKLTQIYFIHGTFVGDDPFGLMPALKRIRPNLKEETQASIRLKVKKIYDHLARDTGNYLPAYASIFKEACGFEGKCLTLNWSSANHHAARILGCLELMRRLEKNLTKNGKDKILLQAHSHGGQLFAFLSLLLSENTMSKQLWEELIDLKYTKPEEQQRLTASLSKVHFDFVTYGTPYRYPWQLSSKMRLLNIVNHRGSGHLATHTLGFWRTAGGDYVQQWGIAGSDSLATSSRERKLNRSIDQILGQGLSPSLWLANVTKGMRVPRVGRTVLVDYRDDSTVLPNFWKTIVGHGVYTRYKVMLFNTELVVQNFYQK